MSPDFQAFIHAVQASDHVDLSGIPTSDTQAQMATLTRLVNNAAAAGTITAERAQSILADGARRLSPSPAVGAGVARIAHTTLTRVATPLVSQEFREASPDAQVRLYIAAPRDRAVDKEMRAIIHERYQSAAPAQQDAIKHMLTEARNTLQDNIADLEEPLEHLQPIHDLLSNDATGVLYDPTASNVANIDREINLVTTVLSRRMAATERQKNALPHNDTGRERLDQVIKQFDRALRGLNEVRPYLASNPREALKKLEHCEHAVEGALDSLRTRSGRLDLLAQALAPAPQVGSQPRPPHSFAVEEHRHFNFPRGSTTDTSVTIEGGLSDQTTAAASPTPAASPVPLILDLSLEEVVGSIENVPDELREAFARPFTSVDTSTQETLFTLLKEAVTDCRILKGMLHSPAEAQDKMMDIMVVLGRQLDEICTRKEALPPGDPKRAPLEQLEREYNLITNVLGAAYQELETPSTPTAGFQLLDDLESTSLQRLGAAATGIPRLQALLISERGEIQIL